MAGCKFFDKAQSPTDDIKNEVELLQVAGMERFGTIFTISTHVYINLY